jgi:hypothetical protein
MRLYHFTNLAALIGADSMAVLQNSDGESFNAVDIAFT